MKVQTKTKNKAGDPYSCAKCSEPILPGQDYYTWAFRYGGVRRQHVSHGYPKPSQLTQSKMSGVYSAVEDAEEAISAAGDRADIAQALNDCAENVESVKDEYQDGLDNLPEQFQESHQNNEKIEELDGFISTLQDAASSIEDGVEDEPEVMEEHLKPCPMVDESVNDGCTCGKVEADEEHDQWESDQEDDLQKAKDEATNALGEVP